MEDNDNNDWNIWARDTINKYIQNQYLCCWLAKVECGITIFFYKLYSIATHKQQIIVSKNPTKTF